MSRLWRTFSRHIRPSAITHTATAYSAYHARAMISTNTNTAETKSNLEDIVPNKSPSDERKYKIVTLPNKLECILISDPDTEKAACAVDVRVGHFADPEYLPGLAHFLEHMLFLGTKKYPNEAEYKQFLKNHGGSSNASTGMHDTCFQFDVGSEHLEAAVDRFAQFFITPLFTESATDRELNAVNSENSNNLQSDPHRFFQFDKSRAKASHPFHKFGTGNLQTLKNGSVDLRQELLSFYDRYYSASVMKLAIVGQQDTDALHALVASKFGGVANKNTLPPQYGEDVFDLAANGGMLYKLTPIVEHRELKLSWMLPSCYEDVRTQPTSLLSYCLGDESPGSILSYLKELGLATALSAGLSYSLPEFALMSVSVSLTPAGLTRYDEIVRIIYRYISKMEQVTDAEWRAYFEERSKVRQMNFNFKGKEKAYSYSRALAQKLQKQNYARENFLELSSGLLFECDVDLIRKYLRGLTVDNCYVMMIGKEFEAECDAEEKWYGTKYKAEKIDDAVLQKWKLAAETTTAAAEKKLFTPLPNPYIADDFSIFCDDDGKHDAADDDGDAKALPFVVRETDESKIWFKQDTRFQKPKLCVTVRLYSPLLNDTTLTQGLTDLILMIFNDELSDATYAFEEASLSFSASFNGSNAIQFSFGGYNQKLPLLVETVLQKFQALVITREKYEINREKYARIVQSTKKAQPYTHCDMVDTLFLCPRALSLSDLEEALSQITFEGAQQQYARIFDKLYVEAFVYGNVDEQVSVKPYYDLLDKYVVQKMRAKYPLKELEKDTQGCLRLSPNANYSVSFECPNDEDENSCISTNFLLKADTAKDFAPLRLFAHLCNAPCFDQLRTKEQLGYIVWSFQDITRGFLSFRVMVQSACANPNKINSRIESFLRSFRTHIESMDDDTFALNKRSVVNSLLEKTKSVYEQNNRYWSEIRSGRYQFNRRENVAAEIEKLSKKDILDFYDAFIGEKASQRAKLTVQCFGNKHKLALDDDAGKDDKEWCYKDDSVVEWNANDVHTVREKCGYYPFTYFDTSKL